MHLSKSRTYIKIKYIQTIVDFHLQFYNQKSIKSVNDFSRLFLILFISDNHTNQDASLEIGYLTRPHIGNTTI